ncbi:MAG: hypothetical protein ABIT91_13295 [Gemmatimonadaceae bacterium]
MPRASELVQLFATSDSASTYAAQYIGAERVSRPLTIAGSALAAIGMLQDKRMNGYTISGLSLVALSIPFVHRQERALRRAIWWYNADLPAVTPDPH